MDKHTHAFYFSILKIKLGNKNGKKLPLTTENELPQNKLEKKKVQYLNEKKTKESKKYQMLGSKSQDCKGVKFFPKESINDMSSNQTLKTFQKEYQGKNSIKG